VATIELGREMGSGSKRTDSNHEFLAGIFTVAAQAGVFTLMAKEQKSRRAPRLRVDVKSSAVAPIVPEPNSATSIEPARKCSTAPGATQRLLWYFEDRGGFWRVGQLVDSQTAKRGRQKGRTLLEIQGALNRRVTRYSDEVKWE
jgi:hypothetical protein